MRPRNIWYARAPTSIPDVAYSLVRQSIGKPLADNYLQRAICTLYVVNSKRRPLTIPEIELSKIAVKVLLGAVLVDTFHSALEDAEIAFDGNRGPAPIFHKKNIVSMSYDRTIVP